jgi:hypothetical protein
MSNPPNAVPTPGTPISSLVYAFAATGGFDMEAGFTTVRTLEQSTVPTIDVTNALQIELPASFFNDKLGEYDDATQAFAVDSITISAADFKAALLAKEQIVHVGAYQNMYTNFQTYVTTYFGLPDGFATLFTQSSVTLLQSGEGDQDNLFKLFTAPFATDISGNPLDAPDGASELNDDISGNYIKDLSGSIVISDIVKSLRFAVDYNAFGNRTPLGDNEANGPTNFGVNNRFLAGDLFYVPEGTQITLDLDISPELQQTPFNNPNLSNLSAFGIGGSSITGLTTAGTDAATTFNSSSVTGDYTIASTVTRTNINRLLKVPLLLRVTADPA